MEVEELQLEKREHLQDLINTTEENTSLHQYILEKKAYWKTAMTKDTLEGLTADTSAMICDKLSVTQLRAELSAKGLIYPDNKRGSAENKKAAIRLLRKAIRNLCPTNKLDRTSVTEQETQTPLNGAVDDNSSLSPIAREN